MNIQMSWFVSLINFNDFDIIWVYEYTAVMLSLNNFNDFVMISVPRDVLLINGILMQSLWKRRKECFLQTMKIWRNGKL